MVNFLRYFISITQSFPECLARSKIRMKKTILFKDVQSFLDDVYTSEERERVNIGRNEVREMRDAHYDFIEATTFPRIQKKRTMYIGGKKDKVVQPLTWWPDWKVADTGVAFINNRWVNQEVDTKFVISPPHATIVSPHLILKESQIFVQNVSVPEIMILQRSCAALINNAKFSYSCTEKNHCYKLVPNEALRKDFIMHINDMLCYMFG